MNRGKSRRATYSSEIISLPFTVPPSRRSIRTVIVVGVAGELMGVRPVHLTVSAHVMTRVFGEGARFVDVGEIAAAGSSRLQSGLAGRWASGGNRWRADSTRTRPIAETPRIRRAVAN